MNFAICISAPDRQNTSRMVTLLMNCMSLIRYNPLSFFVTKNQGFLYDLCPFFNIPFAILSLKISIHLDNRAGGIEMAFFYYTLCFIVLIFYDGVISEWI